MERRIRRKGTQLAHHGGIPEAAWASNYQDSGLQAGSTSLGSRDLLKVKAHQAEDEEGIPWTNEEAEARAEELTPNVYMALGNRDADSAANRARNEAENEAVANIHYCAGSPRFFYTWLGKMVVEGIGGFVRDLGQHSALQEWASPSRPVQGAVARASSRVMPQLAMQQ